MRGGGIGNGSSSSLFWTTVGAEEVSLGANDTEDGLMLRRGLGLRVETTVGDPSTLLSGSNRLVSSSRDLPFLDDFDFLYCTHEERERESERGRALSSVTIRYFKAKHTDHSGKGNSRSLYESI